MGAGYDPGDGNLRFGGWIWRYDLAPLGPSETELGLTYDWSAVPEGCAQASSHLSPPITWTTRWPAWPGWSLPEGPAGVREVERHLDGSLSGLGSPVSRGPRTTMGARHQGARD